MVLSITGRPAMAFNSQTFAEEFMLILNEHRESLSLDPITLSASLSEIASEHSLNMAEKKIVFGHEGFSSRCAEARQALGGGNLCAENVAMGQKSPKQAFDAWINSPGHRANIEQSRHSHTGFGFAKSVEGKWYWTEIFLETN